MTKKWIITVGTLALSSTSSCNPGSVSLGGHHRQGKQSCSHSQFLFFSSRVNCSALVPFFSKHSPYVPTSYIMLLEGPLWNVRVNTTPNTAITRRTCKSPHILPFFLESVTIRDICVKTINGSWESAFQANAYGSTKLLQKSTGCTRLSSPFLLLEDETGKKLGTCSANSSLAVSK